LHDASFTGNFHPCSVISLLAIITTLYRTVLHNDIRVTYPLTHIFSFQMYDPSKATVVYNGKTYSVLSHVAADGTGSDCQAGFLSVDAGYAIAPDNADSIAVIAAHTWSTDVVIVASGNGYRAVNFPTAGALHASDLLLTSGSMYMPGSCNMQVLQVIYIRVLPFHCSLL
jgi:hypothetical protein